LGCLRKIYSLRPTRLENLLRARGGEIAYSGGFVEHYLMTALYPVGMTRDLQILLGAAVLVWTAVVYGFALRPRAPVGRARTRERLPQRAG